MPKLNRCTIGFEFEFGSINDRYTKVNITHKGQVWTICPNNNRGSIKFDIDLPTQVVLQFTGKDPDTDTLVDQDGNIVGDMYVKIISISLDGFKIKENFLHQKMKLLTDNGQEVVSSYIGFNGKILLDMPESDVFSQYFSMNYEQ